jgi:N-acetylglutamate synthase-like GNAT family acetyltransferase
MTPPAVALNQGPCRLDAEDLERVIAIDRGHTGHSRRRFFEKRFAAARTHPDDFVQIGVMRGGALRGFAVAHLLRGEFGHRDVVAVLDAVGVERESQEIGIGQSLIEELIKALRQKGVSSLHSQAEWTSEHLLHYFAASGFELSPRLVLERPAGDPLIEAGDDV